MARSDIKAGKAFVELYVKNNSFVKGLGAASAQLKKFGASVSQIGGAMRSVGKYALGMGATMGAGFGFGIKAASDMEETMNKFNVVFGTNATAVKAWSDEFAASVGRSKKQVADFMGNTQDLLVPLGFASGAATDMSKEITGLAVDLASFNNMSDDAVIRDLHAALTGSGEVMKKYGVIVSEAAVKQELLNQGLDPKTATNAQKVQARMNLIMAGTTAAQGDATRSAGSFANQMKALKATVMDTAVEVGTALLPTVTEWVSQAREAVLMVSKWVSQNPELIKQFASLVLKVVAAGAAIAGLGFAITSAVSLIGGAITVVGTLIGLLTNPIGFVLFASIGTAAFLMRDQLSDAFGTIKDGFGAMMDALTAGDLTGAFEILSATIKKIWVDMYSHMSAETENFLLEGSQGILGLVGLDNEQYSEARARVIRDERDVAQMQADRALAQAKARSKARIEKEAEGESPHDKAKRYMDELTKLEEADEAKKKLNTKGPVAGGFSASALARLGAGARPTEKEMLDALKKIAGEAKLWDKIHTILNTRLKMPEFT